MQRCDFATLLGSFITEEISALMQPSFVTPQWTVSRSMTSVMSSKHVHQTAENQVIIETQQTVSAKEKSVVSGDSDFTYFRGLPQQTEQSTTYHDR